jgi:hypothetical protein
MSYTKQLLAMGSTFGLEKLREALDTVTLDDVVGVIGLERKPGAGKWLSVAGLVTVSAAVGAGVALLLAPSSGTKLRARLSDGLEDAKHRVSDRISDFEQQRHQRHTLS